MRITFLERPCADKPWVEFAQKYMQFSMCQCLKFAVNSIEYIGILKLWSASDNKNYYSTLGEGTEVWACSNPTTLVGGKAKDPLPQPGVGRGKDKAQGLQPQAEGL